MSNSPRYRVEYKEYKGEWELFDLVHTFEEASRLFDELEALPHVRQVKITQLHRYIDKVPFWEQPGE